MRKIKATIVFILICPILFGQNYQAEFKDLYAKNDTIAQRKLLAEWKKATPDDPELYTSYFNYFYAKSLQEIITIDPQPKSEQSFGILDSLGQVAGYMNNSVIYKEEMVEKGFQYIDKGIGKFPSRLDMRFGKIHLLGQITNWEEYTQEILKAIEYSNEIAHKWTWTDDQPVKDSVNFFLGALQEYIVTLYVTGDDSLLLKMRVIAEKVLEYHPKHIESLSNISVTYLLLGEFDKGIEVLLKAEKINPKDYIILNNIAQGYKSKGDKKRAMKYYNKTIKYGDEKAVQFAKQQIKDLNEEEK